MKKTFVLFIAIFVFATASQAQDINKVFKKYSTDEHFEYVSVGSLLMKLAKKFVPGEFDNLMSRMKGMKILTLSQTEENASLFLKFQDDVTKLTANKSFETMVASRSKTDKTSIYRRITKTDNADVLIVIQNSNEVNLIWFSGKATKEELDKFFQDEQENNEE